jgi:ribose/xylose/arabinose/galactoside ABC-type transport system permease subunit
MDNYVKVPSKTNSVLSKTSTFIPLIQKLFDNFIWIILLLVFIFFTVETNKFLTVTNIINIMVHSSVLGLLVIGETLVLLTGGIDLSGESIMAFCATLAAWLILPHKPYEGLLGLGIGLPPILGIILLIFLGSLIGVFNGILITKARLEPFIVTLGMQIILRGGVYIISGGNTFIGLPPLYNFLGGASLGIIPVSIIVLIFFYLLFFIILTYTPFGRYLYVIGGNKEAAFVAGVEVDKNLIEVYMLSGALAAIAGWMLSGRLESVVPRLGEGMTMEIVAAAVMGGISLQGGRGKIIGAFGGVLLLSIIASGLNLMQVSPFWIQTIQGAIILIAMLIDSLKLHYYKR